MPRPPDPTPAIPGRAADLAYTAAGTGAVKRTAQAKLDEVLSVKDFGAVGDGAADDHAAIVAAFAAQAATGQPVRFPGRGVYNTSAGNILHSAANGRVFGDGATVRYTGTARVLAPVIFGGETSHFEGITFDANRTAWFAGYSHRSRQRFDCCLFANALSDGFTGHAAGSWWSDYLAANGVAGAADANGVIVDENTFARCEWLDNGYAYRSKNTAWDTGITLTFTNGSATVTLAGGTADLRPYARPGDTLESPVIGILGHDRTGVVSAVTRTTLTLEKAYAGATVTSAVTAVNAGWRKNGFDHLLHPRNDALATGTVSGTAGQDHVTGAGTDFGNAEFTKLRGGDLIVVYGDLYCIRDLSGSFTDGLANIDVGTQRIYITTTLRRSFAGANYLICHGDGIHGHRYGDNGLWSILGGMGRRNGGCAVATNSLYGWNVVGGNWDNNGAAAVGIGLSGGNAAPVYRTQLSKPYMESTGTAEDIVLSAVAGLTVDQPTTGAYENTVYEVNAAAQYVMLEDGRLTVSGDDVIRHRGGGLGNVDMFRAADGRWRSGGRLTGAHVLQPVLATVAAASIGSIAAGGSATVPVTVPVHNVLSHDLIVGYRIHLQPRNTTGGLVPVCTVNGRGWAGQSVTFQLTVHNVGGSAGTCDVDVMVVN